MIPSKSLKENTFYIYRNYDKDTIVYIDKINKSAKGLFNVYFFYVKNNIVDFNMKTELWNYYIESDVDEYFGKPKLLNKLKSIVENQIFL